MENVHHMLRTESIPRGLWAISEFGFKNERSCYLKVNHSIPFQLLRLAEVRNIKPEECLQVIINIVETFSQEDFDKFHAKSLPPTEDA